MPRLQSRRSGAALKVLQDARDRMESKLSGLHAQDFKRTSLEDARKAVLDMETQMAARGCLRNTRRLMPLFEGLHHYSKVIEVLCNAVPFMPMVWAPIKFILNVTCENVKAFDKIIAQYSRIGEALVRFKTLQVTFAENPEFQQIVAVFYSDILEFNGEAYRFVTKSGKQNRHPKLSAVCDLRLIVADQRGKSSSSHHGADLRGDSSQSWTT